MIVIIGSKSHILHLLWGSWRGFSVISPQTWMDWMKPGT